MKYLLILFSCLTLNSYGQCNDYAITVDDCYVNIDCKGQRIKQIPVNGMSAYQYGTLVKLSNSAAYWNGRIKYINNYPTIDSLFADVARWQSNCLSYDTSGANQDSLYNANASKWLSNGDTIDIISGSGTDDQTLSISNDTLSIESGNFVVLPASGGGTDDQKIDTFSISGSIISLSIESDGEAAKTLTVPSGNTYSNVTNGDTLFLLENDIKKDTTVFETVANTLTVSGDSICADNCVKVPKRLPLVDTLTDADTIVWDASIVEKATVVLGGDRVLSIINSINGQDDLTLKIVQDATGSRTLSYLNVDFPSGTSPTLTTTANAVDIISIINMGSQLYGAALLDFK